VPLATTISRVFLIYSTAVPSRCIARDEANDETNERTEYPTLPSPSRLQASRGLWEKSTRLGFLVVKAHRLSASACSCSPAA
jgi:hypothetical protein